MAVPIGTMPLVTAVAKERPIIFSAESVRSIIAGTKWQTRRVMKPQPWNDPVDSQWWRWESKRLSAGYCHTNLEALIRLAETHCPKGKRGDLLWVKEAWSPIDRLIAGYDREDPIDVAYRADHCAIAWERDNVHRLDVRSLNWDLIKWQTPLFMPRWAARLVLELLSVRVERLHTIGAMDAKAEGYESVEAYRAAWNAINGKWEANPFVWVLEFRLLFHHGSVSP